MEQSPGGQPQSPEGAGGAAERASLRDRIVHAAGAVYDRVAQRREIDPSQIPGGPFCGFVAPEMQDELARQGVNTRERVIDFADGRRHHYVEDDNGIVIDPTWKQFLDPTLTMSDPSLPDVLVGTRDQIRDFLQRKGLAGVLGKIWGDHPEGTVIDLDDDRQSYGDDEGWGWSERDTAPPIDPADDEPWPDYGPGGSYDLPGSSAGGASEVSAHGRATIGEMADGFASIVETFPTKEMVQTVGQIEAALVHFAQDVDTPFLQQALASLRSASEMVQTSVVQITSSGREVGEYLSRDVSANRSVEPPDPGRYGGRTKEEHMQKIEALRQRVQALIEQVEEELQRFDYTADGSTSSHLENAHWDMGSSMESLREVVSDLGLAQQHLKEHEDEKRRRKEEEDRRKAEAAAEQARQQQAQQQRPPQNPTGGWGSGASWLNK
jgi:hypothetical protein